MKLNIVILEGPGGSGKSSIVNELHQDDCFCHKISFPFCSSPAEEDRNEIKNSIALRTKATPYTVALEMLDEQMFRIYDSARDLIKFKPHEACATLYIDRAWVSTYVYQLAQMKEGYSFKAWSEVVGIRLRSLIESLNQLGFEEVKINVVILLPTFEALIGRKIARIAADDHKKLTQLGFVQEIQLATRKVYDEFTQIVDPSGIFMVERTACANVLVTYLSFDPKDKTVKEVAEKVLHYVGGAD